MAASQLQDHDVPLYRKKDPISAGSLIVREDFETAYPAIGRQMLHAHVATRCWVVANPDAMTQPPSKTSGLSPNIVQLRFSRIDLTGEGAGPAQLAGILAPCRS